MRNLGELRGQPIASRMLQRLVDGHPPPLLILHGPDGTGKVSAAEAFVQQRLCEQRTGCGTCASCRKILRGDHADVIVFPEEKVAIGDADHPEVFTVRWLLRHRIPYAPFDGSERFILFPRADLLLHEAETALLKTLEETPAHTRFIYVTRSIDLLKQTVVSRGMTVPFRRLPRGVMQEMTKAGDDTLDLAGGSLEPLILLESQLCAEARRRIKDAFAHPQALLDLEAWLRSGERSAFKDLTEPDTYSYSEVLDFAALLILRDAQELPARAAIRSAVFDFKGDLNQDMAGLTPYLISRLFAELAVALFPKQAGVRGAS